MRKTLVIATPIFCMAGTALRILSSKYPAASGAVVVGQKLSFVAMLSVLAVIFMLVVLICTRKQRHAEAAAPKTAGVFMFAAAVALGFDSVMKTLENVMSEIKIDVFPLILSISEFISAIILVVFSCMILTGFDFKYEKSLLLSLVPLIWLLVKLSYEFLGYTRVANISSHYFHMLMSASTVMFLLYYFKSSAKNFSEGAGSVIVLSLPSVLFSFMCVVPAAVTALRDSEISLLEAVSGFDIACLLISVFAYIVSLKLVFGRENRVLREIADDDFDD